MRSTRVGDRSTEALPRKSGRRRGALVTGRRGEERMGENAVQNVMDIVSRYGLQVMSQHGIKKINVLTLKE